MFTRKNANFMWRSIVLFLARGWTFPSSVTWNAVKNMDANYDTWDVPYKLLFFPHQSEYRTSLSV